MKSFRVWSNYWKKYATEAELHMDGSIDAIFEDADGVPHHENADLVVEFKTGLKDKNDKEIYKGDIVSGYTYCIETFEIAWREDVAGWFGFAATDDYTCPLCNIKHVEVIGNIHENAELLEGKQCS